MTKESKALYVFAKYLIIITGSAIMIISIILIWIFLLGLDNNFFLTPFILGGAGYYSIIFMNKLAKRIIKKFE